MTKPYASKTRSSKELLTSHESFLHVVSSELSSQKSSRLIILLIVKSSVGFVLSEYWARKEENKGVFSGSGSSFLEAQTRIWCDDRWISVTLRSPWGQWMRLFCGHRDKKKFGKLRRGSEAHWDTNWFCCSRWIHSTSEVIDTWGERDWSRRPSRGWRQVECLFWPQIWGHRSLIGLESGSDSRLEVDQRVEQGQLSICKQT